jgi:hypothetical protein
MIKSKWPCQIMINTLNLGCCYKQKCVNGSSPVLETKPGKISANYYAYTTSTLPLWCSANHNVVFSTTLPDIITSLRHRESFNDHGVVKCVCVCVRVCVCVFVCLSKMICAWGTSQAALGYSNVNTFLDMFASTIKERVTVSCLTPDEESLLSAVN